MGFGNFYMDPFRRCMSPGKFIHCFDVLITLLSYLSSDKT